MNRRQAKKVLDRVCREDGPHLLANPWRPRTEARAMRVIAKRWAMHNEQGPTAAWYALNRLEGRAYRGICWRGGTPPSRGYGSFRYADELRGGR